VNPAMRPETRPQPIEHRGGGGVPGAPRHAESEVVGALVIMRPEVQLR
jgi:hypothetical protein